MVSTLNTIKRILLPSSLCLLGWISNASFAGEFFTIIGPDGRPMVVQGKASESPEKQVKPGRKQEEKGTREVSEVKIGRAHV